MKKLVLFASIFCMIGAGLMFANEAQGLAWAQCRNDTYMRTAKSSDQVQCGTWKAECGSNATCTPAGAEADETTCKDEGGNWNGTKCDRLGGTVHTVINVLLYIVGILAVIMIVYSGIRYVMSRGESGEVKGAKDTLMYSIVGLVVAIIAFAIVQWVFSSI